MQLLDQATLVSDQSYAAPAQTMVRDRAPSFGRYLWLMAGVLLAMYCLPLYLVRRADYDRFSGEPYAAALSYSFQTAGQNADILIFGDSTALHGIDPSRMSQELGVKVLSLPNTVSTLRVFNDLALQRYLQSNRPPKLIVFYFAPWDFDYLHSTYPIGLYEGEEALARMGTSKEIWNFVSAHPLDSLQFPFQFYLAERERRKMLWKLVSRQNISEAQEVTETHGHMSNPTPWMLNPDCEFPSSITDNLRFDSVQALGTKYKTAQTAVLYYVAPVPACRNASTVVDRTYAELPAVPPKELPVTVFAGAKLYLHPAREATPAVTQQLIEALRPSLAQIAGR